MCERVRVIVGNLQYTCVLLKMNKSNPCENKPFPTLLAELVEKHLERDRRDAATNERLQQVLALFDRMSVRGEA